MFKNYYWTKQEFKICVVLLELQVLKVFILKELYMCIFFYILDGFLKKMWENYIFISRKVECIINGMVLEKLII